jgi:hypothetical protein
MVPAYGVCFPALDLCTIRCTLFIHMKRLPFLLYAISVVAGCWSSTWHYHVSEQLQCSLNCGGTVFPCLVEQALVPPPLSGARWACSAGSWPLGPTVSPEGREGLGGFNLACARHTFFSHQVLFWHCIWQLMANAVRSA